MAKEIIIDIDVNTKGAQKNVNDLEKQFKRQISITKRSMPGQQLSLEDMELDNSIVIVSDD